MPYPGYAVGEVSQRGEEIYQREIREKVEADNKGRFLIIDIRTGEYDMDDDDMSATDRLLAKDPNAILYGLRIGYPTAYRMGGTWPVSL